MGDVGIVVGILAMMVALGAVFFASVAVRRVEDSSMTLIRSYFDPIKAELTEIRATLADTAKKAHQAEQDCATLKEFQAGVELSLQNVERLLKQLNSPKAAE